MKTLPKGWEEVEIQDIALVDSGQGAPQGDKWYKGNEIFVKAGDLNKLSEGKFVGDFCPNISYDAIEKYKLKKYSSNSIVFPKSGMSVKTDNIALLKYDSYVVNHLAIIQISENNECDPRYLYYFLKRMKISNLSLNSAYPSIRLQDVKKFEIILPPLTTQKKIAAILEKAEQLKEWRKDADRLTDDFLKSTFLEMFGDPVYNLNGWEINKLQNFAEIVSGVTKGRKLSGKSLISAPYLRVANVQDGYLDLKEIKTIEVLPTDIDKYTLLEGDVLLTEGGDPDKLGRGAVWYNEIKNCIHQNHIFRVRVDKAYLIPEFLSILIGSSYGKRYFLKSAKQTTGIASINSKQLKNFPVILPPLDHQNKFANIVHQIEHLQEQQDQSKQHIDNLFNALMQQAFKGELAC